MAVSSRALVEFILLGPTHDRRQLQDSPILGDVWIAFAEAPAAPTDLLISPYKTSAAGPVASAIARRLRVLGRPRTAGNEAHVAYLQGIIAARLYFGDLLRVVVPMTSWWREQKVEQRLRSFDPKELAKIVEAVLRWSAADGDSARAREAAGLGRVTTLERYVALTGLILDAADREQRDLLIHAKDSEAVVSRLLKLFEAIGKDKLDKSLDTLEPQVWQISLNRKAIPALEKSIPAVKGDAARTLFKVKCDEIAWAVVDSGIDAGHPAFKPEGKPSRVVQSFDFTNIRDIVSLDNLDPEAPGFRPRLERLVEGRALNADDAARALQALAQDADNDRPINWGLVQPFLTAIPTAALESGHGTHVAGIIGANGSTGADATHGDGMCPDIKLYDFRVLAKSLEDTEFAVIAALQYIRYLNERHGFITIHGVNLSLSIPHDVRNFACGRTPICNECERLVGSGVVVVAAAGNFGYQAFETKSGAYEGYMAFSITDPGNADGVITVGATHRFWPHTYGVSFFSSRGPTGDGRPKPDLVAPGERIRSCLPQGEWGELDGTSMAAPHVSGAAAMLMARYSELIGQPERIKKILCESATDLGRERSFQGHGMLDVLRAFQRI
jgi:serine protease AprX